jgi:predicted O-methyltransferase YrrM
MGRVIDASDQSDETRAIRKLNDFIAGDARVESVMLAISDGLTIVRKK